MSKADYVRSALRSGKRGPHHCHWPGCTERVPPEAWGCLPHWRRLPKPIQDAIWSAFRPGQEKTKTPNAAYIEAARAAQDWIAANYPPQTQGTLSL